MFVLIYIRVYKSETGWLTLYLSAFVCVLLGDGSGGVFFFGNDNNGVVFSLGSVPRWYFLRGPFRGCIFFGVRSEGPRWGSKPRHTDRQVVGRNGDFDFDLYFRNASCLEELDQRNLWRVKLLNNAIKDEIGWWGTLHSHHSSLLSNEYRA
jgi:hypothetical protein